MNIEYWNPVPIYCADVSNQEFQTIRQEIQSQVKPEMFNQTTWHDLVSTTLDTTTNIVDYLNLQALRTLITNHVKVFIERLGNYSITDVVLFNSWFNCLQQYGFQNTHVHDHKCISGVYYYDYGAADSKSTLTFLLDNHINKETISYEYVPGRIIIFFGLTPHYVTYNQSKTPRTSFSFNFSYTEVNHAPEKHGM
jgi:hypothetical protein